jgi:hypothetical protein
MSFVSPTIKSALYEQDLSSLITDSQTKQKQLLPHSIKSGDKNGLVCQLLGIHNPIVNQLDINSQIANIYIYLWIYNGNTQNSYFYVYGANSTTYTAANHMAFNLKLQDTNSFFAGELRVEKLTLTYGSPSTLTLNAFTVKFLLN